MAVAIAWLPGPAGTRRRVAKPSVEEPDAAEPARPDLWGARASNDPGLPDREVPLPTFQAVTQADPLNRRVVEQMLVGVATRHYARSLESVPAGVVSRGTSKSSVSRRFVAKTTGQLRAWQSAPLDGLDLVALLLDGVHVGEHCLVVALGIAADGQKHALGLWEGATENTAVCQSLLANLQSRGLRTDRSLLVILDGAQALHKATRAVFGAAALIQRCQVHKLRNILDHLPERQRPWVQAIVRRCFSALRKKAFAAAMPRARLRKNSTVLPCPSTARYRYIHWPRTLINVSSTRQLPPTGRSNRLQRLSQISA